MKGSNKIISDVFIKHGKCFQASLSEDITDIHQKSCFDSKENKSLMQEKFVTF